MKDAIKGLVGLMLTVGIGAMVKEGGKYVTPENAGKLKRMCISLSLGTIAAMTIVKAIDHSNKEIDEGFAILDKIRNKKKIHNLGSEGTSHE